MNDEYEHGDIPLPRLVDMICYSATILKNTPPHELDAVRDDILELAGIIIPAAEYIEERGT